VFLVGCVALVTAGAQTRCTGSTGDGAHPPGDNPGGGGPTFVATLQLKDSAGYPAVTFRRGDIIHFELTVRNRTASTAHLQFESGQQSDFLVVRNGFDTPLWFWSENRAFAQVSTEISFAPLESRVFSVEWNQQRLDGTALDMGSYEARGVLLFDEFGETPLDPHELGSELQAFVIMN
jgi:hypothetical protein